MRPIQTTTRRVLRAFLISIIVALFNTVGFSQDISIYHYRHVPQDKIDEFIKRESTYWNKVAQKAIDDGKLEFWGFFQKMGEVDIPNSSNFLFIVTPKNIDDIDGIWNPSELFPDTPMDQMETFSMSTITSHIYVKPSGWQELENADPVNHFKYMSMVYHTSSDPAGVVDAENEIWGPFIKSAMDNGKTTQTAWGNARILSPSGPDVKFNTISYDLFPSLKEALDTRFDVMEEVPDMTKIMDLETGQRGSVVYRIISVASAE